MKEGTNKLQQVTAYAKDHPAVIWLGIAASLIVVLSFLYSLLLIGAESDSRPIDRELSSSLLDAVHQLGRNLEYLDSFKENISGEAEYLPVGTLDYHAVNNFFCRYFDKVATGVCGEEDKLIPLVKLAHSAAESLKGSTDVKTLRKFDAKFAFTIDDLRFLTGFLRWYLGGVAKGHLSENFLISLRRPHDSLHVIAGDLSMRYFLDDEGRPITEYGYYLGLID